MSGSLAFRRNLLVEAVKSLGLGAVKIEPPITNEVFLVEDGAVGAQEGVLGKTTGTVGGAHMESLTFGFGISIVS